MTKTVPAKALRDLLKETIRFHTDQHGRGCNVNACELTEAIVWARHALKKAA